ncbi:hypothetical protein SXIM_08120 [Streptomyces xiamenensis]|uniref:Uncharacterized protein n=1 Tax=Streptomyces xiamenensis TaxID=408015 RepID=A0A0F7CN30_9ACTN|nr:hypothetical protein SXIM_08120 [Streptomyces xiamenensis]
MVSGAESVTGGSADREALVMKVDGMAGEFSRPAFAITTAMYGMTVPTARVATASGLLRSHSTNVRRTAAVRINMEMT